MSAVISLLCVEGTLHLCRRRDQTTLKCVEIKLRSFILKSAARGLGLITPP